MQKHEEKNTTLFKCAGQMNKTANGDSTLYLYDGASILMELDENGTKTAYYAYGSNIDEPIFMVISGASYYYHADHLGSIRVLTDANEDIVATYQYDAFGTILQEMGSVNNPYRFTGREWDVGSGLYYYRARYYDAIFGRFLQKDPEGVVDGPNLYTYVGNNPVRYIDPTGKLSCCKEWGWGWRWPPYYCKKSGSWGFDTEYWKSCTTFTSITTGAGYTCYMGAIGCIFAIVFTLFGIAVFLACIGIACGAYATVAFTCGVTALRCK